MSVLQQLLDNHILICAFLGYFIAQIVKSVIELIVSKKFSFSRLITGNGGMPSSHSATVCALATTAGFECGLSSPVFAISVIFAIVVMTDASGVRRETGKQAVVINDLVEHFKKIAKYPFNQEVAHEHLKELVGHTPLQVQVGALLGIVIAVAMHFGVWY